MPVLDLDAAGICCVVWATGFAFDFSWIDAPGGFDACGYPVQQRGASPVAGLFYLGLNWLSKRKSGIIFGVSEDAEHVAGLVARHLGSRAARREVQ